VSRDFSQDERRRDARVVVMFRQDELDEIEQFWKEETRYSSRNEAIRELLRIGLAHVPAGR
jgi:metal-responsive CopG/Arc/MetJ family transcriptional regulator